MGVDEGKVRRVRSRRRPAPPEQAVNRWIEQQLAPASIDDSACERLIRRREALAQPLGELYEFKERVLDLAKVFELVRGLRHYSVLKLFTGLAIAALIA